MKASSSAAPTPRSTFPPPRSTSISSRRSSTASAPWQALQTVTSTATFAAGVSKDLGTIAPGYLADLILVEGDPLTNIKDVTRVQCVMKNGAIHSTADILFPFVQSTTGNDICPAR